METGIFRKGGCYRVKCDFSSGLSKFSSGEILIFKREGYSRYDEAQIYDFIDSAGATKSWSFFDRQPEDWKDCFEPV